jgi:hypothetical protein
VISSRRGAEDLVEQNRAGDREVGAPRLEPGHAQPLLEIERRQLLRTRRSCLARCGELRSTPSWPAVAGGGATAPRLEMVPDVPITRSNPARAICARYLPTSSSMCRPAALVAPVDRIGLHEALGQADDAELEAAAESMSIRSARDFHAGRRRCR